MLPAALASGMALVSAGTEGIRTETWGITAGLAMLMWTFGVGPSLKAHFQLQSLAPEVRQLEELDRPVAWVGQYQGQLHFLGRLERPLTVLRAPTVAEWVDAHPDGALLIPLKREPLAGLPVGTRRFRVERGWIALVPAQLWSRLAPVVSGAGH